MKIVFVLTKYLCYNSNAVFMKAMKKVLEKQGIEVIWCEIMEEKAAQEELQKLIGKHFDAILDFNSVLPLAMTSKDEYVLDLIDAPFYNYIVDHPMFHHKVIDLPLKNYHIICVDQNHKKYVEACYPHIRSVTFLPLAAMPAVMPTKFEQKKIDILFPGTYMPSKEHYDKIQSFEPQKRKMVWDLIERMLADHALTLEQAVAQWWLEKGVVLTNLELKTKMLECYWADYYVRTHYRESLIDGLLKNGRKLTIVGAGWETFHTAYDKQVKIIDAVGYLLGLQMLANARIVLNVQPLFKAGVHDRVLSAMMNRSVAVTDTSTYIEENFDTKKDLVIYQPDKIDSLAEQLGMLLEQPQRLEEMALAGYEKTYEQHTWVNRMTQLIKIMKD